MADAQQPWLLAVNLVNPHDVMFIDTDAPGEKVQWHQALNENQPMSPSQPPENVLYAARWDKSPCPKAAISPLISRAGPPRSGTISRPEPYWSDSFLMRIVVGRNCVTTILTAFAIMTAIWFACWMNWMHWACGRKPLSCLPPTTGKCRVTIRCMVKALVSITSRCTFR